RHRAPCAASAVRTLPGGRPDPRRERCAQARLLVGDEHAVVWNVEYLVRGRARMAGRDHPGDAVAGSATRATKWCLLVHLGDPPALERVRTTRTRTCVRSDSE